MMGLLVAFVGATAVLALTAAVWLPLRAQEGVLRRRLDGFVDTRSAPAATATLGGLGKIRRRLQSNEAASGRLQRFLERRIQKAQLALTPNEVLIGAAVASVTAFMVGFVVNGILMAAIAAAAMPLLVLGILSNRANAIQRRFSDQLADTVALLANSVRAGQSVQQALEQVARDTAEPTRSAFALAVREIGFGASLPEALERLQERYPSEDVELVVTAINVHSVIGGSLVKILETTAETIRDRSRMIAEVKALTAQQRYSAYVLALLPVVAFVGLRLISPDYGNELLREGVMRFALMGAATLVVVGFLLMRRMASSDD